MESSSAETPAGLTALLRRLLKPLPRWGVSGLFSGDQPNSPDTPALETLLWSIDSGTEAMLLADLYEQDQKSSNGDKPTRKH